MERRRANLLITGKVQGVFFRESAKREALRLGLTGRVRNLPGGEVEAVAEGERDAVEAFIRWCHRGPSAARVDGVVVKDASPTGEFSSFDVER
jgi:acylphosphatase